MTWRAAVEVEPLHQRGRGRVARQEIAAAVAPGFRNDHVDHDLALRGEQCREGRLLRCHLVDIGSEQPIEEFACISPATLTTPRSGNRAAFISVPILIVQGNVRRGAGHLKGAEPANDQNRLGKCAYWRDSRMENSPLRMRADSPSEYLAVASSP